MTQKSIISRLQDIIDKIAINNEVTYKEINPQKTGGAIIIMTADASVDHVEARVIRNYLEFHPKYPFINVPGYTTRSPGPGEQDGEEYHFVNAAEFSSYHDFYECLDIGGTKYGYRISDVINMLREGYYPIVFPPLGEAETKKRMFIEKGLPIIEIHLKKRE